MSRKRKPRAWSREELAEKLREAERLPEPRAVIDPHGRHYLSALLVIQALRKTKGSVYKAAELLGVSSVIIYGYIKRNPTVRQEKTDIDGQMVDRAEIALFDAVEDEQPWAVKYLLSTKGKDRGYVTRVEQTGPGGSPLGSSLLPDLSGMTDEQMQKMAERFLQAAATVVRLKNEPFSKTPMLEDEPNVVDVESTDVEEDQNNGHR